MAEGMTEKPYIERLGGSYVRDRKTGESRLVERTDAPPPPPAPAAAEPAGEPKKSSAKRSD